MHTLFLSQAHTHMHTHTHEHIMSHETKRNEAEHEEKFMAYLVITTRVSNINKYIGVSRNLGVYSAID